MCGRKPNDEPRHLESVYNPADSFSTALCQALIRVPTFGERFEQINPFRFESFRSRIVFPWPSTFFVFIEIIHLVGPLHYVGTQRCLDIYMTRVCTGGNRQRSPTGCFRSVHADCSKHNGVHRTRCISKFPPLIARLASSDHHLLSHPPLKSSFNRPLISAPPSTPISVVVVVTAIVHTHEQNGSTFCGRPL